MKTIEKRNMFESIKFKIQRRNSYIFSANSNTNIRQYRFSEPISFIINQFIEIHSHKDVDVIFVLCVLPYANQGYIACPTHLFIIYYPIPETDFMI